MKLGLPLSLTALLVLGACATATPYQAATESGARGYSEQQVESNRWQVSFAGNSLTDRARTVFWKGERHAIRGPLRERDTVDVDLPFTGVCDRHPQGRRAVCVDGGAREVNYLGLDEEPIFRDFNSIASNKPQQGNSIPKTYHSNLHRPTELT